MDLLCRIRDLQHEIAALEVRMERINGLSLNTGMLLCTLRKSGKMTCGQLVERLGLSPSNTSKVIRQAEDRSLIVRTVGAEDKRRMYFSLTEKGRKELDRILAHEWEISPGLQRYLELP